MKTIFKNQNFRFWIELKSKSTGLVIPFQDVRKIKATLYRAKGEEVWAKFMYDLSSGIDSGSHEITVENDRFYIDLTTDIMKEALTGDTVFAVAFEITDSSFLEGFKVIYSKGLIFNVKEVVKWEA